MKQLADFERGFLLGILIGEAHFGLDRGRPQLVIGMHSRHEPLLRRIQALLPGMRLYGPFHYKGRDFMRLMARGEALEEMLPLLDLLEIQQWCPHAGERYRRMRAAA